jgi:CxxC motif-containing protein (DUF1111 family)
MNGIKSISPIIHAFICLVCLVCHVCCSGAQAQQLVPLFDASTKLEPATSEDTPTAFITRFADRARDRHAREASFHAYDHYLSFYWEERTIEVEIVDRVAKGGNDITVNYTTLAPLGAAEFRTFFRGINTVAEYHSNQIASEVSPNHYTATISTNMTEKRPLQKGDAMEMEISQFLKEVKHGRKNYYGTTVLYVVGQGIVPWVGKGQRLDSAPLPERAWLGGLTTLPYQYSDEPKEHFKQLAGNMAPVSVQPFMLGRRLHHTDFADGSHSETGNPIYEGQKGKLGPQFVAQSCVACHVNNGRALPPAMGAAMLQSVVKMGRDAKGTAHPKLGGSLQPQSQQGEPETKLSLSGYTTVAGKFTDGTRYALQKPQYAFAGEAPSHFSVRLTPQLVGMGLLEAIDETDVLALAAANQKRSDSVRGRPQIITDEAGKPRLGRFGYKAGQPTVRHQIASAFNSDMGITTALAPSLDGADRTQTAPPELAPDDLANLTRYISTLGVSARRDLEDAQAQRGEQLFTQANCATCHRPSFTTSKHHPLAELRGQKIQPFTDLLLHDMGAGLADNMGEHLATGSEWRTPPLWSIGLTAGVSGGEAYLHDGRARTLEEAILWHGGESESSKESFRALSAADRAALVKFLKSL